MDIIYNIISGKSIMDIALLSLVIMCHYSGNHYSGNNIGTKGGVASSAFFFAALSLPSLSPFSFNATSLPYCPSSSLPYPCWASPFEVQQGSSNNGRIGGALVRHGFVDDLQFVI